MSANFQIYFSSKWVSNIYVSNRLTMIKCRSLSFWLNYIGIHQCDIWCWYFICLRNWCWCFKDQHCDCRRGLSGSRYPVRTRIFIYSDRSIIRCHFRITLNIGGDDITEFLLALLQRINFPYKEADLARLYDWRLMEELKSKICTLQEVNIHGRNSSSQWPNVHISCFSDRCSLEQLWFHGATTGKGDREV